MLTTDLIGKDFEAGLANLRRLAERRKPQDFNSLALSSIDAAGT